MADPFKKGDEAREKFLETQLHANDEAAADSKVSDLFDKGSNIYKNPVVNVKPAPEPAQEKPTTDAEGFPIVEQLHTYREDLADIVKSDKLSMSRIAMMEGTANKGIPAGATPAPKKRINVFLVASIALGVVGLGIIGGVAALVMQRQSAAVAVQTAPAEKYIIFSEKKQPISIAGMSKSVFASTVKSFGANFKEEDNVMEIVPTLGSASTSARATFQDVLRTADTRIPDSLARTIAPQFFLGDYSSKGTSYPFLLFYVNSYDIAYPGLLDWEGLMPDDMNWLFDTSPATATSTLSLTFKDRVVANEDARSYETADGQSAFFYLFLDQNTVLMARTADTVREVEDRLRQAKFQ